MSCNVRGTSHILGLFFFSEFAFCRFALIRQQDTVTENMGKRTKLKLRKLWSLAVWVGQLSQQDALDLNF